MIMSIFLTIVSFTKAELCPKFSCGNLTSPLCTNNTSENPVPTYVLQKCKEADEICPFYNHEKFSSLSCINASNVSVLLYPGAPCNYNTDCFSQKCENLTCVGSGNKSICTKNEDCIYGESCRKNETTGQKICGPQSKDKESCTNDYDCINTHGCYNKSCIEYFSLPDGHPVEPNPPQTLSLCQSGYQYDMKCASLFLKGGKDFECNDDTPCNYTNFDNTTIVIPENCLCGYNPFGKKYCRLGSAHEEYKTNINNLKKLLNNSKNCNTVERDICNHDKKYSTKDFNFLANNYTNSKIIINSYHELINSDKCIISVAYPQYREDEPTPVPPTPPVPPGPEKTCGKFFCKVNSSNCAHSHYNTNSSLEIVLSDICNSTSICYIGKGKPNDVFYNVNKTDVYGTCLKQQPPPKTRFPGESCSSDFDCYVSKTNDTKIGNCTNKICGGYSLNQNCSNNADCLIGLYCNPNTSKCANLKNVNEICLNTKECQNSLVCLSGICKNALYSLKVGEYVNSNDTDLETKRQYCVFGRISKSGKCDYLNNTDVADRESNLVNCTPGSNCNYTTSEGNVTMPCECGYNAEGLAYCPRGNNLSNYYL
jgi:hypothetical protein